MKLIKKLFQVFLMLFTASCFIAGAISCSTTSDDSESSQESNTGTDSGTGSGTDSGSSAGTTTVYGTESTALSSVTVFIVGDSTVCSFTDAYFLPRYGYGTQLGKFLSSKAVINNLALSGRSSKSFITEANYTTLTSSIKSGDYLIISFGHNDEKSDDTERYSAPTLDAKDTEGTFQYYLYNYYVKVAKDAGATPILCTPIVRISSSDDYSGSCGHITADGDYPACIRNLGTNTNTTVIDLTALTKAKYEAVKYDTAKYFHACTTGKYDTDGTTVIPSWTSIDGTHINFYGATEVSYLFANALSATSNGLASYVNSGISEPDYATYYPKAINSSYTVPNYTAVDWTSYTADTNYSTLTKSTLTYSGSDAGYGWCGTAFGDLGGLTKKWYATETSSGTFKVGQSATDNGGTAAGKISTTSEGYAFLFSQINASYNFTVKATLTVSETASTKQEGFGLMLRDDCYAPVKDASIHSNLVSTGIYTPDGTAMYANWSVASATQSKADTISGNLYATGDTVTCTIKRVGQVVTCTTVYNGTTYEETYTDFDFQAIDNGYMYAGIMATRGTVVTCSDLTITIDGVSQGA